MGLDSVLPAIVSLAAGYLAVALVADLVKKRSERPKMLDETKHSVEEEEEASDDRRIPLNSEAATTTPHKTDPLAMVFASDVKKRESGRPEKKHADALW